MQSPTQPENWQHDNFNLCPPGNKRSHQKSVLAAAMTRGSCGSVESALTALYYTCKISAWHNFYKVFD